jgi:galactonate dehydratase
MSGCQTANGRPFANADRSQYFEGGRALTAAISAIDIALYDVVGKSLGVPCYQLLGGAHRHHIPCMVTVQGQPTVEACCDEVAARVSEGWTCIRINHFDSDQEFQREMAEGVDGSPDGIFEPRAAIASQVRALLAVRERVGTAPVLGVDFHHRLSVAECASFCQRLPGGTLDWIEEGIRDESPEAYEELRKLTPVPFAIGEEFASKWQFLPFIEKGLTNYARVDICNVGGFTEAMKVAGHCEAHYIDLLPHNPLGPVSTAACVHLGAAVPNFAWLEDNFSPETMHSQWPHEIFPKHTKRESTMERHATLGYPLPTAPGHGVEINEDYLQGGGAAELTGMVGGLRRKDGSLTNW